METTDVNLDQHTISSHVNQMTTPFLNPKNNRLFIEKNRNNLTNSKTFER